MDNIKQLFDKSYNAVGVNIMYSTFKQNTLRIIDNNVNPVILSNECLNIICDTIDVLISEDTINNSVNKDNIDEGETNLSQENDMLKLEIKNMNKKLDLLMSMLNKK
jgi:hypothetical protein